MGRNLDSRQQLEFVEKQVDHNNLLQPEIHKLFQESILMNRDLLLIFFQNHQMNIHLFYDFK
jgi:hypothetical protein